MGILNVTPDSFSDGGNYLDPDRALAHAMQLRVDGAQIIDIGGESTRPGSQPVENAEEMRRVIPVIEKLRANSEVTISIDTSKAAVARAAMAAGADIINDVTAFTGDPDMLSVARETGAGVILMHMQGNPRTMQTAPRYADVVGEVREFLRQQFEASVASGVDPMRIALDPGIGFGKSQEHNLTLLRNCGALQVGGRPVVIGSSRKSLLAQIVDSPNTDDRFWPGVALTSLCRQLGARIFRVHEPKPHIEAMRMTEAILDTAE